MKDDGNDMNHDDGVNEDQGMSSYDARDDASLVEDYLDQALTEGQLSRFEERMQTDLVLRRRVAELRSLRRDLEALPREASVPDRVWDGILAQIQDGSTVKGNAGQRSNIIALSSAASVAGATDAPARRQFSFSMPQLAAAAVVLVSLGGAMTWAMSSDAPSVAVTASPGAVSQVATVEEDDPVQALFVEYEASSAALMEIVNNGASVLSVETVEIVRESVNAIDLAVSEARDALKQDPGSEMLNRILLSNMQKKLDLLRATAAAVQSMA